MKFEALEHDLRTYRPAGMEDLPAEFVWPRYEGLSVGNIAATAAHALGARLPGALPPLRKDLLAGMLDGVKRVIVLVVDALGWEQLQGVMAVHDDLVFHRLAETGRLMPLTTTFLSTTNSVLSTIWTGRPPIEHGLLAFTLFLREWSMAVEAITLSPIHRPFSAMLTEWGLDPEAFLPVPALGQVLSVQGILSYAVILDQFVTTPLSRMHFRGMRDVRGHAQASEFWLMLRRVLQEHRGERFLLSGYWSAVDGLGHRYGPLDETGEVEIRSIATLMEEIFLKRLEPADGEGTLLLMTADHGQITTPPESAIVLDDHPLLRDALFMPPVGESRVPFFYVRSGQDEAVWRYLNEHFSEQFVFLSRDQVIHSGLLGPGKPYQEVPYRLGDIVGVARGDAFLVRDKLSVERMRGRHGGLGPQEMLVPLLAVRLDA
jgi:hypothetical protein